MAITASSLQSIPASFATCSIGCKPEHTLPVRLDAIARAGFIAIELSMPDLLSFAESHFGFKVDPYDFDKLCTAASQVRQICREKHLQIMMLQPFSNFEGWPEGSPERDDAFVRAKGWIRIMLAAGTDLLQVGSSDTPASKIGSDRTRFVSDLRELAHLLAEHHLRLAYENWCWSSHAPDWADVWDIVQKIDRPNVGLCLDTFQTAGGEWADPCTSDGLLESHDTIQREERFKASLEKLATTVPADKIYLLQISDAHKPPKPFTRAPDGDGLMPRGRWSHDYRPLPFQGYLPVVQVAQAVLRTGFRGWFSYEVFDSGQDGKGRDYDLNEYAKEAMATQDKLLEACCTDT